MELSDTIKVWLDLESEEKELRDKASQLRKQRMSLSATILATMRDDDIDEFPIEAGGKKVGTLARSVRIVRPTIKRANLRIQLLTHFTGQHEKVRDFLELLERPATPSGEPITRETLTLRRPREKKEKGK
jgi:hypothetical protein